jgi:hypothetical protein
LPRCRRWVAAAASAESLEPKREPHARSGRGFQQLTTIDLLFHERSMVRARQQLERQAAKPAFVSIGRRRRLNPRRAGTKREQCSDFAHLIELFAL